MQEDETGEDIPAAGAPQRGAAPGTDARQDNPRPRPAGWRGRVSWGASLAGAAIIATGAGFGIASLVACPGGPAPFRRRSRRPRRGRPRSRRTTT